MQCTEIRKRLPEFLEDTLSAADKAMLGEHLAACPDCLKIFLEMEKTVDMIKNLDEVEPPPWLTKKVMEQVRAEQQKKINIWDRLVGRFSLGIPVTAAATLAVAVTAVVIIKSMEPGIHDSMRPAATVEAPVPGTKQEESDKTIYSAPEGEPASRGITDDARKEMQESSPALSQKSSEAPAPLLPEKPILERGSDFSAERKDSIGNDPALGGASQGMENSIPGPGREPASIQAVPAAPAAPAAAKAHRPSGALSAAGADRDTASVKDAPLEEKAVRQHLRAKKEKSAESGKQITERVVTEHYSNGMPAVIKSHRVTPSGRRMIMEERFDDSGRRHGMHLAYDASERIRAEVLYERGQIKSVTEYGTDGSVKKGVSAQDWPWLNPGLK